MPLKLSISDGAGHRSERYVDETELPLVIGRKPPATLVLGGDVALSSTHCRLELSADGSVLLLTDLESKNGTRVNDVALRPAEARCVNVGDCIGVGRTTLVVEFFFAVVSDAAEDDDVAEAVAAMTTSNAQCATCAKSFAGWSDEAMTAHVVDCHLAHGGASASPSALSCPSCRLNLAGMDDVAASVHMDRCTAVPACPLCHRIWLDWDEDARAEHAAECGASATVEPISAKRARRRAPQPSAASAPISFKRLSKRQARLAWAVRETAAARVKMVAAQAALDTTDWSVRVQALRKDAATCERVLADRSNHAQWIEGGAPLQGDWPQCREALLRGEIQAAVALRAELYAHVRALTAEADLLAGQIALAHHRAPNTADKRDAASSSSRLAPLCRQ